jgi:hypothetical protein
MLLLQQHGMLSLSTCTKSKQCSSPAATSFLPANLLHPNTHPNSYLESAPATSYQHTAHNSTCVQTSKRHCSRSITPSCCCLLPAKLNMYTLQGRQLRAAAPCCCYLPLSSIASHRKSTTYMQLSLPADSGQRPCLLQASADAGSRGVERHLMLAIVAVQLLMAAV